MNLLQRLKVAAQNERTAALAMLRLLIEAEDTKLYAEMAYPSLFAFCVAELSFSEGAASRRINAARLLRENECVAEKIEDGSLSLVNASKVQQVIKEAAKEKVGLRTEELIEKVSGVSTREAEKKIAEVAEEYGFEKPAEKLGRKDDSVEQAIEVLKAYFSHKNSNPSHDELFILMAEEVRGRKGDISAKAKNPEKRAAPGKLYDAISTRDDHCCSFSVNGKRCGGTYFLQLDHIIPVAHGGLTVAENLRMLCFAHNLLEAERRGLPRPANPSGGVASR